MSRVAGWLERLDDASTAARLASIVGVVLVVAAFGMLVSRSVELEFHNRQPFWVADAIPAVVSELYYGHQKRYTALESVNRRFHARVDREVATARTINAALRRLQETANEDPGTAIVLLGPDDKGIVDLIEGGFLLYGVRTESIVTFYFTLLLLSCVLYGVAFWRSPAALLLLASFIGMFYLIMPMMMHNGQLRSILALRALPILSIVACLHCLLFMANGLSARISPLQVLLVALQILLITFTIHLRSTTLWQVATILGFGTAALLVPVAWRFVASRGTGKALTPHPPPLRIALIGCDVVRGTIVAGPRPDVPATGEGEPARTSEVLPSPLRGRGAGGEGLPGRGISSSLIAIGLMVAGYLGLQAYHAIALPEEYRRGDEIATRVFWHNIFTGFAYHPDLQPRFQIWLDDVSIMAATGRYLVETGQSERWLDMGGKLPVSDPVTSPASSFEGVKFAKYDPAVREMLAARCATFPWECLETLLWYKPVSLLGNLAWLYGFREQPPDLEVTVSPYFGDILKRQFLGITDGLDSRGWRAYLWTPRVLLIVVPFVVLLLTETRQRTWAALGAVVGLTLGSTIPTVAGYAAPHTISETAIVAGMLVYLVVGIALAAGLRHVLIRQKPLTPTPSPARGEGVGVRG